MTARYWVLVSDALLAGELGRLLPDGLRMADPGELVIQVRDGPADQRRLTGAHWRLFEDDAAPDELDGHRVELIIEARDGRPVITRREPLT